MEVLGGVLRVLKTVVGGSTKVPVGLKETKAEFSLILNRMCCVDIF